MEAAPSSVASEPRSERRPLEIFADVAPLAQFPLATEAMRESCRVSLAPTLERASGERLYALIDGAAAIDVAIAARQLGHRVYTLFEGESAASAAHAGPILVPLESDPTRFLECWVETRGRSAGVLLLTPAPLERLFPHLRHIFVVRETSGLEYFLRFYDPRVLRRVLPTCTAEEITEFFGPLRAFVVEDAAGERYESVTRASAARALSRG